MHIYLKLDVENRRREASMLQSRSEVSGPSRLTLSHISRISEFLYVLTLSAFVDFSETE
jgi:hypothetical protein